MTTITGYKCITVSLSDGTELDVLRYLPDWAFDSLDQALDQVVEPMLNDDDDDDDDDDLGRHRCNCFGSF